MQIGNLPVPYSSSFAPQTRHPRHEARPEDNGLLPPMEARKPVQRLASPSGLDSRSGLLAQRVFNPAFNPTATHSGHHAVTTYRAVAGASGPELLNRVDVSA